MAHIDRERERERERESKRAQKRDIIAVNILIKYSSPVYLKTAMNKLNVCISLLFLQCCHDIKSMK